MARCWRSGRGASATPRALEMGAEAPQPDRVWACAAYRAALAYPMEHASFCADAWQPARASHRLDAGRLDHRSRQRHVVPQDRHWEREDAIAEGVAAVPEIEHDPVCEPVAEPVAQPTYVPQVTTGDGGSCLHLDACDPAAWTLPARSRPRGGRGLRKLATNATEFQQPPLPTLGSGRRSAWLARSGRRTNAWRWATPLPGARRCRRGRPTAPPSPTGRP